MQLDTLIGLAQNMALSGLVGLALAWLHARRDLIEPRFRQLLLGLACGLAALAAMAAPVRPAPDLALDGGLVILGLAGALGGWPAAAVAFGIAAAGGVVLAGPSMAALPVAPALAAAAGVACRHHAQRSGGLDHLLLALLGLALAGIALAVLVLRPEAQAARAFAAFAVPVVLAFPLGTVLLGGLLLHQQRRWRTEAQLKDVAQRFGAVFHSTFQFMAMLDRHGVLRQANGTLLEFCGLDAGRIAGRPLAAAPWWPASPAVAARIQAAVNGAREGRFVRCEETIIGAGGRRATVDFSLKPVLADTGRVAFIVAEGRDITERLAQEEQLRQSHRLLAVGQLTGGVAHEFNNLLTVAIGHADLILTQARDADVRDSAEAIFAAGRRGADLTRQLLAFSRRQTLQPKRLDVDNVLRELARFARRMLGETIRLDVRRDGQAWPVVADDTNLQGALLNLVLNARDAMPHGGTIALSADNAAVDAAEATQAEIAPGRYTRITVRDDGIGMAPDVAARAFEPFFTTKEVGKGTGLGLSMVYGFVKQSGGHVALASAPGGGTTVTILLPAALAAPAAATERAGLHRIGNGATVLVVEDDREVLAVAAAMLRRQGYRVFEAADGPAALALLEHAGRIDLLFTDVVMPDGMTGWDLAEEVRRRRPEIEVIYTSGCSENVAAAQGIRLLRKPYTQEELQATLEAAMRDIRAIRSVTAAG